jgi:Tol biopolymer transport system component
MKIATRFPLAYLFGILTIAMFNNITPILAQEKPQNLPDIQTVNTKNPRLLKTLNSQGNNSAIAITPDGKTLLTGGQ